jgi:uncharacterized membrane protein
MESKTKVLGHPLHPQMVNFPLGLFTWAVVFDLVYVLTKDRRFAAVAYWNIVGGLLGGGGAAVVGFWDWLHIPPKTRAKRIGLAHGAGNLVVVSVFLLSFAERQSQKHHVPNSVAILAGLGGVALLTATAWLGGELVDRLGVGVDEGANLNAPSSLSGKFIEFSFDPNALRRF